MKILLLKGPSSGGSPSNVVKAWGCHLVVVRSLNVPFLCVYSGAKAPKIGEILTEKSRPLYTIIGTGSRPFLSSPVCWVFQEKLGQVKEAIQELLESGEGPHYDGEISWEVRRRFEKDTILLSLALD